MATDISTEGPAGFSKFNDYADMNRGAFLSATAPAVYAAIQLRNDSTASYTDGTEFKDQVGAIFNLKGNQATATGEMREEVTANADTKIGVDVKPEAYTPV